MNGKSILELGCGERHLTGTVFSEAGSVRGIDTSDIAVARAARRHLANARFENADLLDISFAGFEVIAAIECLYYLPKTSGRPSSARGGAST